MDMSVKHVGLLINVFLMMASIVYLLYSVFYYPRSSTYSDPRNYFDALFGSTDSCCLFLAVFSSILLFVSIFGYMSLTEDENMILTEMFFLLLMIAVEAYSIYYLYAEEGELNSTIASYMYKGVVLPHRLNKNSTDKTLELTYAALNDFKWRCCGIYSWIDAESYRPKDCCRTGYKGVPGKGMCNEHYGPYVKNCVEVRSTAVVMEINRYALVMVSMILIQFFGLMLCGMVVFVETEDKHRPFAVVIRDIFVKTGQNATRRRIAIRKET